MDGVKQSQQYRELANAIALQVEALAQGKIPEGQRYATVQLIKSNVAMLEAWTDDDRDKGRT